MRTATTKEDVSTTIQAHRERLTALGVKRLGLFGSFVRDEPTPDSDVDMLVEFEADRKTFDNFMQLSFLLEEVLARPVELVTSESLSPYLRRYILEEVEYVPLDA